MSRRAGWPVLALCPTIVLATTHTTEVEASHAGEPDRPVEGVDVTWTPETPGQGRLFTVRVAPSGEASVAGVTGTAATEPLHFEAIGDGSLTSLAAVPIGAEGTIALTLDVRYLDGGSESIRHDVPVAAGAYRHERLTVAPRFGTPLDSADQAHLERDRLKAAEVSRRAHATPRLWSDTLVMPRVDRVTSEFGNGRIFNGEVSGRHLGLDLDGDPGDTVRAPTRGVVELVDRFLLAGNIVYLNHGGGLLSGYFHLSEQLVAEGDTVHAGTPVGLIGATGRVTGPHLHWVVRYGSTSVDPRSLPGLDPGG